MSATIYDQSVVSDDLARLVRSSQAARSVRSCLLMTRDRDFALGMVKRTVTDLKVPLYHFTITGRRRYNPARLSWEPVGTESPDPFDLLKNSQELRGGGAVVFEDLVPFLRNEGGDLRLRMLLAQMLSAEHTCDGTALIFLEPPESANHLPSIIADQVTRVSVPYPRLQDLEAITREEIARIAAKANIQIGVEQIGEEAARLAPGIVGVTRSAARDALRDSLVADPKDFDAAFERLQRRKKDQLGRELSMNLLDTEGAEEPVGLDYLKDYLLMTAKRITLTGKDRARGVLLIGPPGTGKTMLARAIGKIVDLPVVEFRISSLMNSLLGETERRFAQAFATLEAMAPNVVFIDEVEKAFGDSSERDGGTMMRCTGALLSWLSDNPYPNFIVATSNSLRRMGEIGLTMTRSERFDASFFLDVPDHDSRRRMLVRWLEGKIANPGETASELAGFTEKFSGADLRSIVKKALDRAEHETTGLTLEILKAEAERKRMRAIALYDEFQDLRRWGRLNCEPAGPTEN